MAGFGWQHCCVRRDRRNWPAGLALREILTYLMVLRMQIWRQEQEAHLECVEGVKTRILTLNFKVGIRAIMARRNELQPIEEVTEEVNSTARHPLENVYNEVSKMVENGPKFDEIGVYSNVASLMAKYNDLCALVQQDKPDIILLAETWLTSSIPDGMVSLNGYTLFRRDRIGSKGGGVCIYLADEVLSTFHVSNIPTKTPGTESLFLKLSNKDTTLLLGCIYRPPSSVVDNDKILVESLSHLADSYATLLLFGDFNMPDITWPIDPRCSYKPSSQLFVDLLTHSHLRQLVTQPTRHRLNQNPSTLDLIVCSDDHSLTNLDYLAPIGISDHSTLKIDLQICQSPPRRTVSFTRTVTDYRAVNNDLAKTNWEALLSDESIVKNWSTFKNTLQSLLHRHTKSYFVKHSSTKPWINGRLLQQINRKRALWRTYKRSGSELDYRIHREFSNRLSTAIKEARCVYEKNVAEAKDAKKLYKYIRTKFTGPVSTPRLKNTFGEVLDNNKIIADTFADAFSNVFTIEPSGCLPKLNNICKPISFSDISFTTDVVHKKLKQLKVSKSPGPDLITAKTLHECADTLSEVLCFRYSAY
ncbi:uncharacterized protein LOC135128171 [Zophobas morio]|uniref:uncharacterized protein LOC135128171 n=1 Tax=Zophobas morio TaxID=2755281 RepID=UPI003083C957